MKNLFQISSYPYKKQTVLYSMILVYEKNKIEEKNDDS